jgi:hypothetical protein
LFCSSPSLFCSAFYTSWYIFATALPLLVLFLIFLVNLPLSTIILNLLFLYRLLLISSSNDTIPTIVPSRSETVHMQNNSASRVYYRFRVVSN